MVQNRPRASAAVLRDGGREVLMVKHRRRDGTEYLQLPGGGILPGESRGDAVLRELREETGLVGRVIQQLFSLPYKYGTSTTFLVQVDPAASAALGSDPEEACADYQKLVGVAWHSLVDDIGSPEIERLRQLL